MKKRSQFFAAHTVLICVIFFMISKIGVAQDIHFTQFTLMPLVINPAQAGTTVWIRAATDYRTQWRSIAEPYKTIAISFDQKIKKRWAKQAETIFSRKKTLFFQKVSETGLGWGVLVFSDKAGNSKMGTTQANFSLAYQAKTSQHTMLAAGLQAGVAQRSVRFNDLKWGSQYNGTNYDPNLSSQEDFSNSSIVYPDLGAGVMWTFRKNERYMRGNDQKDVYIGASLSHLLQPSYSFFGTDEKLYRKFILHGHSLLGVKNTNYSLTPAFMYARQGAAEEILMGTLVRYMLKEDSRYTGYVKGAAVSVGGYYRGYFHSPEYRQPDALVIAGMYEMSSYSIGISYDINISKLKTVSYGRGGLEITLRFLNPSPFLYSQASFK